MSFAGRGHAKQPWKRIHERLLRLAAQHLPAGPNVRLRACNGGQAVDACDTHNQYANGR
jgi:hypothetical protein